MNAKINIIGIEACDGTANFTPPGEFHPYVSILRGADITAENQEGWPYYRTYHHVTPSSMVRAFLAIMKLMEREKAGLK